MRSFFLLLMAAAVSMLVIPVGRRLAPWLGMVDLPDARKVHRAPVARVGGWGIICGALLPIALITPMDPLVRSYFLGSLILFAFGLWDDARQISHWPKFIGQGLAVAIVVFYGDLYVTRLPFFYGDAMPPLVGQVFTMIALIGVINAINHSDGLDGLAGGETLLSLVALSFLGYLAGSDIILDISLAVIGGIIGFLRFNTHPALVFMGDSGSQFLGFTLGFLVIYFVQVASPATSAALPLLLIGLPIADILAVLYQRVSGGMNWFKATRNHVHHKLLDLGFSHYESVVTIYTLQALLVVSAVLLRFADDALVLGLYVGVVTLVFVLLWRAAARRGLQRDGEGSVVPISVLVRLPGVLRSSPVAQFVPLAMIGSAIPVATVGAALWAQQVPRDFGIAAGVTSLLLLALVLATHRAQSVAVRTSIYVTVAYAAYLFVRYPGAGSDAAMVAINTGMFGLAALLVLYVRFISSHRFELTPTDYLIVFAMLALALFLRFDSARFGDSVAVAFVLYSVVLFYACEVVIGNLQHWRYLLGASAGATLMIVAIRGVNGGM